MKFLDNTSYEIADDLILNNGMIPLTYWTVTPNFGDLLSPYLIEKMTQQSVKLVRFKPGRARSRWTFRKNPPSYLAIGSIISRARENSIVWGSGAFGTETRSDLNKKTKYLAVRGPLTRNLLRIHQIECPEVYGDPALLMPLVYYPKVEKKYKIGVILRWAESEWNDVDADEGVKKIYLGTDDIEGTLKEILSCENIVSSSLHGIILADAYRIPSAWLASTTPKGLEFKFYDYFLSVNKVQKPQRFNFNVKAITCADLETQLVFDDRKINFDEKKLLQACPFITLT
jgi:pyruvyltransferase